MNAYECVEALLIYANENLLLDELDEIYTRNKLYDYLGLDGKFPEISIGTEKLADTEYPDSILDALCSALKIEGERAVQVKDGVMDIVSLTPKNIANTFDTLYAAKPEKATDFLYDYCIKNYYVKSKTLKLNPSYGEKRKGGEIRYTINLARPEFDNKASAPNYPKCSICLENQGNGARVRRNLRTVPLILNDESWFWQYSPYGYFTEHGIAVCAEHRPMQINRTTFERLLDFVDQFPHYFLGSNAALAGVGGSVLSHDHYQGGKESLPMQNCKTSVKVDYDSDVKVSVIDWYACALRLESANRKKLIDAADRIRQAWQSYTDEARAIIADDGEKHNAIAPIARKVNGVYIIDILLKNNRADAAHPLGIFHVPQKYQCLKKESIGLIEAQGLFILPGRLNTQLKTLTDAIEKGKPLPNDMSEFNEFRADIADGKDAEKRVKTAVCDALVKILESTSPFKTQNETAEFAKAALAASPDTETK